MKRILLLAPILLIIASCCSIVSSTREIGDFKIDISFSKDHGCNVARISGKQLDSALWIRSYDIVYEDQRITININRCLKQTGMSGLYFVEFLVPPTVTQIRLSSGNIVWEKPKQGIQESK